VGGGGRDGEEGKSGKGDSKKKKASPMFESRDTQKRSTWERGGNALPLGQGKKEKQTQK